MLPVTSKDVKELIS